VRFPSLRSEYAASRKSSLNCTFEPSPFRADGASVRAVHGTVSRSIFDRYNIVSERHLRGAMQRTQTYLTATAQEEAKRKPAQMARPN